MAKKGGAEGGNTRGGYWVRKVVGAYLSAFGGVGGGGGGVWCGGGGVVIMAKYKKGKVSGWAWKKKGGCDERGHGWSENQPWKEVEQKSTGA